MGFKIVRVNAGAVVQIFNGRSVHLAQSGKVKSVNVRPSVGDLPRPTIRCRVAGSINVPKNSHALAFKKSERVGVYVRAAKNCDCRAIIFAVFRPDEMMSGEQVRASLTKSDG